MSDADRVRAREPWRELRGRLVAAGIRPSRRLGQNFLVDPNMVRAIARDAGVQPGELVLEVGVGLGFLTEALLDAGAEVVAIEIDERLLALARERLGPRPGLLLVEGDALDGKHRLAPALDQALGQRPWQLVANLPYSIAAPLLVVLARRSPPPAAMTVLVQKEVGARLVARPGTPAWGPLSVRLQLDHEVGSLRELGPELFWPKPRVESSLVRLVRRGDALLPEQWAELDPLLQTLFTRRRQALGRVLGERCGDREAVRRGLAALGHAPELRAEVLTAAELLRLSQSELWRGRPR